ncbi:MAG: tetratricopeptide repeat protein [Pararhodobacter sp.]
MKQAPAFLNLVVAATLTLTSGVAPVHAQTADLDRLLEQLADPEEDRWARLERQILREWGRSGSASIDLVFQRGQEALQAGAAEAAIVHFSTVIDHAPDFAEAWNGRATAYFLANRLGQSLSDIEQVLIRNPRHFGALAGLGMIMEQLDRPEEARRAYEASLAIHPHQQSVIDALARLDLAQAGEAL